MKSNGQSLRILLVEDSEDDAELLLLELRRGGFGPVARRVASAEEMKVALDEESYDLVVSDYVMPGFGGLEALALFRERGLQIPFIVVSGHIGEEIAVAAMRAGADDYLMKDRLARLVPAIKRALQESEIRRAHRNANEALRDSEERFRQLAENIGAAFFCYSGLNQCHCSIAGCSTQCLRVFGSDDFHCTYIFSGDDYFLLFTPVVPPCCREMSTGLLCCQAPLVKSGMSMELERLATDHSLSGPIALHAAASYTSMSTGKPLRKQSIRRQSIKKSIPPWPPTCLAISPNFLIMAGVYFSSSCLNSSALTHPS